MKKFTKLVGELDGKCLLIDTPKDAPMNARRTVNVSSFTDNLAEAKDFYFFQGDIPATIQAIPTIKFYIVNLTSIGEKLIVESKIPDSRFSGAENMG